VYTDEDALEKEEATLRATLIRNGYPPKFTNKVFNQSQKQNPASQETTKSAVVVPCIRGISQKIRRIGKNFGIRTAGFRS
jgi:hypothetical protein